MKQLFSIVKINVPINGFFLILIFFLGFSSNIYSQETQWDWAVHFGGADFDGGRAVCVDQNGNAFMTGYFRGTASFGDIDLTSKGDTDIFLAKLNSEGTLIWVKQFGSEVRENQIVTEIGKALSIDGEGNVYLAGIFRLSAVFGDTTLVSFGGDDIFVAKLNSSGKVLWARNYGTTAYDNVSDIELDNNGNVILTGSFGTKPMNSRFFVSRQKSSYAILGRIDKSGTMELIRAINCVGSVEAKSVAIDKNNSIFWGLNFLGELELNGIKIFSKGKSDILLEKISPSGSNSWSKQIGGRYNDKVNSLAIINNYELLLTGLFEDEITIDKKNLVSKGKADFLICQFNESGKAIWVEQFGSASRDMGVAVVGTTDGNFIVGGNFQDVAITKHDTLFSAGFYDVVILSFDNSHRFLGSQQLGSENNDQLHSMAVSDMQVYTTGNFRGYLNINSEELNSSGSDDILLASLPISIVGEPNSTDNYILETNHNLIEIQPNPSNGVFTIIPIEKSSQVVNISIRNLIGKEIFYKNNTILPIKLNLSSLSNGTYLANFSFNGKIVVKKIVIKH